MKIEWIFQENNKLDSEISVLKEKLKEVDELSITLSLEIEQSSHQRTPGCIGNGEKS